MTTHTSGKPVTVGLDTALVEVGDRATTAFAIGPRSAAAGREQRLRAAAVALGATYDAVAWVNQVHGHDLVDVGVRDVGCVGEADGLMTVRLAHGLAVWSADCVPMLVTGRSTVAAVHAGWRGCAAGIVERSIERLCDVYREEAADLEIRLGPAIGADHYRVGTEVVEALARRAGTDEGWLQAGSHVDLRAFVRRCVVGCGVPAAQVVELGGCTACDPTLASYRRDGARAGRQWSMIVRRGLM